MITKTKAIVLRNTNYGESSIISKMYTREFGVRTYILQSIRKGKSAIITPLLSLHLNIIKYKTIYIIVPKHLVKQTKETLKVLVLLSFSILFRIHLVDTRMPNSAPCHTLFE